MMLRARLAAMFKFSGCSMPCGLVALLLVAAAATGCRHQQEAAPQSVTAPPAMELISPKLRKIVRVVGQPSFVESFERTSIYPKLTGYIEKWYVDIGDKVKKDQVMATLFVPELVEDFGTKRATVELDKQRIELAKKLVEVATADVQAAQASLAEAKAILDKFQSEVDRWDSEVKRLKREVDRGVVDAQVLLESINQLKSSVAARDAAQATIAKAVAELQSKKSTLEKAKVDVLVAVADLAVAESEAKRLQAWVGYLKLTAPYNGVVVARNANTGDFVLPSTGDPTANRRSPNLSPGGNAAPIYVVDRTDVVRIFVDIPERDANYVRVGTKATVLVQAFSDREISANVTRTSWALNVTSRTLRAEIDLLNTGSAIPDDVPEDTRKSLSTEKLPATTSQILPGMYAYGKVIIERDDVRAIPLEALLYNDGRTCYWSYQDGKAMRMEVQTGIKDDHWMEVRRQRRMVPEESADEAAWRSIDGSEQVIIGDFSLLSEGAPVKASDKVHAGAEPPAQGLASPKSASVANEPK